VETWVENRVAFSGSIFSVRTGTVCLDDGSHRRRDIVDHVGGVAIVPIVQDRVVLVRQFRLSIGREIIEIPAGRLEDNESPETCAQREIEEEAGYRAKNLVLVHSYYSSVGFTNERMYIYLAYNLDETSGRPEQDERIQIVRLPITDVEAKLRRHEFEDSKTIIGLYAALAFLDAGGVARVGSSERGHSDPAT
jgi:ADP-ribose pyrophosphatase